MLKLLLFGLISICFPAHILHKIEEESSLPSSVIISILLTPYSCISAISESACIKTAFQRIMTLYHRQGILSLNFLFNLFFFVRIILISLLFPFLNIDNYIWRTEIKGFRAKIQNSPPAGNPAKRRLTRNWRNLRHRLNEPSLSSPQETEQRSGPYQDRTACRCC